MHQLDIFADSLPVQQANVLIAALRRFDSTASRQALQSLTSTDPANVGLPHFQVLCEFVDNWSTDCDALGRPRTPAAVADAAQLISEQIIPAAVTMGDAGTALVRKCWSDLARASEAVGIGPDHADCFAAELYLRAWQSPDVVRTAQGIPGAALRAAVQRWLGLGYCRCGKTGSARSAVFRYAWLAPKRFSAFVEEMGDAALTRDWLNFQADLDDLDATWFPAWCVHEKKTGAAMLDSLPSGDGPLAYRLCSP